MLIDQIKRNYVFWILARIRPHKRVTRHGIRYELNCNEKIDYHIYWYGAWERETVQFLQNFLRPGQVVMEIGANIGAHTGLIASRLGQEGRVVAVEPTEFARTKLERNIAINPSIADRVSIENYLIVAPSTTAPRRTIKASWSKETKSSGGSFETTSPTITLDELAIAKGLARVDMLKIDIDGYDYFALQGAVGILARYRPIIFIELSDDEARRCGHSLADTFALLTAAGYQGYTPGTYSPLPTQPTEQEIRAINGSNGFFLPSERSLGSYL